MDAREVDMGSQTLKRRMEHRVTSRRRYLLKRWLFALSAILGGLAVLSLGFGGLALMYMFAAEGNFAASIGTFLGLGVLALLIVFVRQRGVRKVESIRYVAPVREQVAAAPADEVLLRGSFEPTATPAELLRAVTTAAQTKSDELLRAGERTTVRSRRIETRRKIAVTFRPDRSTLAADLIDKPATAG